MQISLHKIPTVLARLGCERTQIFDRTKSGLFPRPIKRGRDALWASHEIDAMVLATLREFNDAQLRQIVAGLEMARKNPELLHSGILANLLETGVA